MLAVKVDKLRQRQPVNRLGVVICGVVIPDITVIRAGGQHWFRFVERDNAHLF
ncbi:hypothetical protein KG656_004624 [Escherichia coli]|uniref:hypothetical protein n=1 Tax=Escherichia coli TaxID=562 RepID=UPI00136BD059|nr:hypothetical protein [Escherichia coli]EHM8463019.1 hypothetical protein [Escherichia coli]EJG7401992.1 hypothetical protein [Escherichia coli]EKP8472269.1 hypothetical protein [Escherichia coli]EKQ0376543.1 hypothetical protein [Escherichia coli]ELD0412747.1 hypothetical protein [Escherichia coli]